MADEYTYNKPMSLSEIKQKLNGRRLDIPGMFEFARQQGVRVSDLSVEEKKMFLK